MSTARREVIPFLSAMTHHCKNRELTVTMAAQYDLEEKHVAFITGSGKTTNKVQGIVEDAEESKAEAAVEHSGGAFEGFASETEADGDTAETEESGTDDEAAEAVADASESGTDTEPDSTSTEEKSDDGQSGLGDFF
jgi:replication factor C large subunit